MPPRRTYIETQETEKPNENPAMQASNEFLGGVLFSSAVLGFTSVVDGLLISFLLQNLNSPQLAGSTDFRLIIGGFLVGTIGGTLGSIYDLVSRVTAREHAWKEATKAETPDSFVKKKAATSQITQSKYGNWLIFS